MMPSRSRSMSYPSVTGTHYRTYKTPASVPDSWIDLPSPQLLSASMIDIVSPYIPGSKYVNENPMSLSRTEWIVHSLAGSYSANGYTYTYRGNAIPQTLTASPAGQASFLNDPQSDAGRATQVAARSNPSRPVVDLPVFLFELKDIPHMIKQAGDAMHWLRKPAKGLKNLPTAEGLANANLAYQFGWEPLLSDLWKLFTFQEAYEKKRNHLMRLYSGIGLRRNVRLETLEDVISGSFSHGVGYGPQMNVGYTRTRKTTIWGSIRWKPTLVPPGLRNPTDSEIYRAALGLDISMSTVWEAIPWSWLIDWFTNAGDFLSAHRNTIPASFSNICIMRMQECEGQFKPSGVPERGTTWGGATMRSVKKSRVVHGSLIYPTAYLPFLGNGQLSILGSLAITRGLHKSK